MNECQQLFMLKEEDPNPSNELQIKLKEITKEAHCGEKEHTPDQVEKEPSVDPGEVASTEVQAETENTVSTEIEAQVETGNTKIIEMILSPPFIEPTPVKNSSLLILISKARKALTQYSCLELKECS